jgi:dolichyl-phosphate beta-glucosyltransferase
MFISGVENLILMIPGPDDFSQTPTRDETVSPSAPARENARRHARSRRTPRAPVVSSQPVTCYLSLIVPAYNEEKRLPATLHRIAEYLALRDFSYELIVVDDGSSDNTRELVREFAATRPFVRLECYDDENGQPLNKGKGFAVRRGVMAARGRDVLFSDADLSTPIEEMEKLLPPISRGDCDISIASRALPESKLAIHQPWYRERMGRFFNSIVRRVIDTDIVDTQCGFKAFRGDVAKHLFSLAKIDGFGFDTEILFLAQKFGYQIEELPVTWIHKDDSRVNPLRAPFQMMGELLEVRLNDIRGRYDVSSDDNAT